MVKIELEEQEALDLHEVLTSFLSDLRMEISQTDNKDWRDNLKEREVFLKKLIRQLEPVSITGAPTFS